MQKRNKGEGGFTLTELLIVVAILGVLVAVVLPNFVGLLGNAQSTSGAAELNIVQTAVDAKMAAENLSSITPITQVNATNDMGPAGFDLAPQYMRSTTTKGTYYVDATGQVSQDTTGY
jgi:prepilin-type N-terminal cleavage/methylation domain-containing protein